MLAVIGITCAVLGIAVFVFFAFSGYNMKQKHPEESIVPAVVIGLLAFMLCTGVGASVMFGYPQ